MRWHHRLQTGDKVLNAITTEYIQRDFLADTGMSLNSYISAPDLGALSKKFMSEKASRYQILYAQYWKSRGQTIPGYYGN